MVIIGVWKKKNEMLYNEINYTVLISIRRPLILHSHGNRCSIGYQSMTSYWLSCQCNWFQAIVCLTMVWWTYQFQPLNLACTRRLFEWFQGKPQTQALLLWTSPGRRANMTLALWDSILIFFLTMEIHRQFAKRSLWKCSLNLYPKCSKPTFSLTNNFVNRKTTLFTCIHCNLILGIFDKMLISVTLPN